MSKRAKWIVPLVVIVGLFAVGLRFLARRATSDTRYKGSAAHRIFDPSRDALHDLRGAEIQALAEHKNILLDVGGNWCPSCFRLEQTLTSNAQLHALLQRGFVVVHVNWSSENRNASVLDQYPSPHGYPALYVLAPDGQLLKSQDTTELESPTSQTSGYTVSSVATFLERYSPHP